MANAGGCLFRIGYYLYTRTRVGYYYHQKDIKKAREKLGDTGHSDMKDFVVGNLNILPIPMLLDNYAYLVSDKKSNKSVLVDPGHAEAVQKVLAQRNVEPEAILVTHKHWDHSGGNKELKEQFPNIPIYGGSIDNVPDSTNSLTEGDTLQFGDLNFRVVFTPGHTVGHIVYLLDGSVFGTDDCLFSGDCLFLGGVGRMFEAPPSTMLSSLDKLLTLPPSTMLWPGHEYAKDNLEFAAHLEPDNDETQRKLEWVKEMRENNASTCPSTLGEERLYNPFLRTSEMSVLRGVGMMDSGDSTKPSEETRARALGLIREHKDKFKYKL
ncbi:probable hydrolase PNKD [Aplysia californica]|uniref:Probable hydrolase PNKD n=1 Tax=Aplysia californica TaxID=6500 RepID=A0ABM0JBK2_APLCA|nr:probable hydrolase PNKD [Aplysia californica]